MGQYDVLAEKKLSPSVINTEIPVEKLWKASYTPPLHDTNQKFQANIQLTSDISRNGVHLQVSQGTR